MLLSFFILYGFEPFTILGSTFLELDHFGVFKNTLNNNNKPSIKYIWPTWTSRDFSSTVKIFLFISSSGQNLE